MPVRMESPAEPGLADRLSPMTRDRLRVAFVNNMPDAAFEETECQFRRLLEHGSAACLLEVRRYALPGPPRGDDVRRRVHEHYFPFDELYVDPPDALIVTGAEPRTPELRAEVYWPRLAELLRWAQARVGSALLSCLASHAALLLFDGVERTRLDAKCSGVFPQNVRHPHALTADVTRVAWPHSRLNGVPTAEVESRGWDVLVESPDSGWTVAAAERGRALVVLLQGHPEYSPDTLLREFRRDVRRFLAGSRPDYPEIPPGSLDAAGQAILRDFETEARTSRADVRLMESFPFAEAERHLCVSWQQASNRFVRNWLREAMRRAAMAGARA